MAKLVLTDADVVVNGVNLSNHCSQVTIESEKDEVDVTSFGATSKEILAGIGDGTITLDVFQDFAAGSVDATLWPLHLAGSTFVVVVKPASAAVSATNPKYTMTGVLLSYSPIAGSVGEASTTSVPIRNASQSGIVRATA